MHILDDGPHGFGMADRMDDETVKAWPTQALRFMARHKMFQSSTPGSYGSQSAGDPR